MQMGLPRKMIEINSGHLFPKCVDDFVTAEGHSRLHLLQTNDDLQPVSTANLGRGN